VSAFAKFPRTIVLGIFSIALFACSGLPFQDAATPSPETSKASKASPTSAPKATQTTRVGDPAEVNPEPTGPMDCEEDLKLPPADCTVGVLTCGATVRASNAGQGKRFDDDFYRQKHCTPEIHDYGASPEAIWALEVPANTQADLVLRSECEDLDLFSIRWPEVGSCPTRSSATGECEGSTRSGGDATKITTVDRAERHLVWVDGKDAAIGNFSIEVRCHQYR
jgi:hypothetical protein